MADDLEFPELPNIEEPSPEPANPNETQPPELLDIGLYSPVFSAGGRQLDVLLRGFDVPPVPRSPMFLFMDDGMVRMPGSPIIPGALFEYLPATGHHLHQPVDNSVHNLPAHPHVPQLEWEDLFLPEELGGRTIDELSPIPGAEALAGIDMEQFDYELSLMGFDNQMIDYSGPRPRLRPVPIPFADIPPETQERDNEQEPEEPESLENLQGDGEAGEFMDMLEEMERNKEHEDEDQEWLWQ